MKYVIVTGAYGGMGASTVKALLAQGYFVFAIDKSVGEPKENLLPIKADLTSDSDVEAAIATVREHTDEVFAIVHFAGIYMLDSLVEIEPKKFARAFDVNVFAAYRINRAALPLLKEGSRIIITTSELAPLDPLPFTGLYAVTKSALDKYAYSLRMELQLLGIKVIQLRPGAVSTDMLGVSTAALDRFCEKTEYYSCNAKRFKSIVESVEARSVSSDTVAEKAVKILASRTPKYIYKINSNPLLIMLSILPKAMQTRIIKLILK